MQEESLGLVKGRVLRIRQARQNDLDCILWGDEYLRPSRQAFLDRQARGEAVILLPTLNDEPVGHLAVDLVWLRDEGGIYLYWFHVLDAFARQGIGTAVVKHAEQLGVQMGRTFSEIAVEKTDGAVRRLYERWGYHLVGERTDRWIEDRPDGSQVEVYGDNWVLRKTLGK
jgi:ribosomal protein S18 acetylase RimI-like enzyme